MRSRCLNQTNASWEHYGGRGISVCDRWINDYDAFVSDMGTAPTGKTLDRIDVNGNYEPNNCRWATYKEQANNKRSNIVITHNGITLTCAEWADSLGIGKDVLFRRLKIYRMDLSKALTEGLLNRRWDHGTRTGYERHNCRCDLCKESNNARHRARRAMKKEFAANE